MDVYYHRHCGVFGKAGHAPCVKFCGKAVDRIGRCFTMLFLFCLLASCAAPAEKTPVPPSQDLPAESGPEETLPPENAGETSSGEEDGSAAWEEAEDHVLLTLDASLADGRTLRLEAVGKKVDEYSYGVREVQVWDGEELLQTVLSREGAASEPVFDGDYTDCWSTEDCMEALDLNFDGNMDFGLFGSRCNNTIPYCYWTWDPEAGRYQFACILQGAEAHPETGETTAEYKSGSAGSQWITEHYKPDENGALYLHRVERLVRNFQPDSGYLDIEREGAREIWLPREGDFLRPRPDEWSIETDLVLVRREVPVLESHDGAFSCFTEVWERQDGVLNLTSREEFTNEDSPE